MPPSKSRTRAQSKAPSQPPPPIPIPRVFGTGSLPYGGLPGRCFYGPEDPPGHFDAGVTNGFLSQQLEASVSWDGHHLLQLLEQKDIEWMRMLDGARPLVLEPDQYLARFWCRTDAETYYFICTKLQGLEYCSQYVKWVNVKSPLYPVVQATTGPSLRQLHVELGEQFYQMEGELRLQLEQQKQPWQFVHITPELYPQQQQQQQQLEEARDVLRVPSVLPGVQQEGLGQQKQQEPQQFQQFQQLSQERPQQQAQQEKQADVVDLTQTPQ
ncbi:hypothetical protein BO86DRAFT_396801 [Aspergillus japonicus CBS 114.51]|uniref:Uncharacterized protein n=1 Tax=Aspergillus japonicus CBS 114.51 TaxID=1448312 RepID=A0A8T8X8Q2_ASPJA|nr:hypothetical protein BO86DRAFT_396801 [Aspergillus japonicus CBS 114.51]RAH84547.1 hypothetical protein BO86DRAFT_396801 [Aspergillus japonicus CBS 114.51]